MSETGKMRKNSLTTKIFIALLLGAAAGALLHGFTDGSAFVQDVLVGGIFYVVGQGFIRRSEERRVGKECRSRWSPYH